MIEYTVKVDGDKTEWYLNGQRHREDGPAIEYTDGGKEWWLNGNPHRVGGPAVEWANDSKFWFLNGKRHREDGPAIEWADGNEEWWLNGILLSEKEFNNRTKPNKLIIELAEKAGSTHKQNLGVYQFYEDELEKFAELIIKEVIEFVKTRRNDIPCTGEEMAGGIKYQFGIE